MATSILTKPSLGPLKVSPWPFQAEAIAAVRAEYRRGIKRTMVVVFTGGGKTLLSAFIGRRVIEKGGRVLFLAPSTELVDQAANKFDLVGIEVGIEQAGQKARAIFEPDAVIASIQTMHPRRLAGWPPDHFKMVIVDECDFGFMGTYRRILKHFGGAHVLGITATSCRADREDLGSFYQSVAYAMTVRDGMTAPPPGPYLCRLEYDQCDVEIDLRDLGRKGDDFSDADLEARIRPVADVLANVIKKEAEARRTLIFTPLVASAQAIATGLQSLGVNAEWSSGDDPEREAKVARFRSGQSQMLASCSLISRGFDVPEVSAIALCRPTRSQTLLDQIIGRGLRAYPGKEICRLIDFSWLTNDYDLARPVGLFETPGMDGEVLEVASELVAKDKQLDLLEAVEQGEVEHRERQVMRIKATERELRYARRRYDPLGIVDVLGIPWRGPRVHHVSCDHATERQVAALTSFGIEGAEKMSKTRASTMLAFLKDRRDRDLARPRQVAALIVNGGMDPGEARALTFGEASARLDEIFGKARRRA